jgi:hypothetical protein
MNYDAVSKKKSKKTKKCKGIATAKSARIKPFTMRDKIARQKE